MTRDELKNIIKKHEKWLNGEDGGERANLYGADLRGANLNGANLNSANLCGTNLYGANLYGADLCGTNLYSANLCCANLNDAELRGADLHCANLCCTNLNGAKLRGADLHCANLCRANLNGANLCCTNLTGANLNDAKLRGANLRGAKLRGANMRGANNLPFIPMSCPDSGSFIAWKKASGYIVKLFIPEDAKRSSATGRKCRCDKAQVLAIENIDGTPANIEAVNSDYDDSFVYEVGKTVTSDFCEDRFKECAEGIHFFINRQEAVEWEA